MKWDFVKNKKIFFIVTLAVIVIGVVSIIVRGFNLDTDFTGGTTMQVEMGHQISSEEEEKICSVLENATGVAVSSFRRAGDGTQFLAKMKEIDSETRVKAFEALKTEFSLEDEALLSVASVGASVSADIRNSAVLSTVVAIVLMLAYISIRFDLSSGLAAVTCLAHDIFIMIAAYSLLQIPMNSTMIAALLTILGYSINATIIIFDRIRESRKRNSKASFEEVVNTGIRGTVTRSLFTSLTTLFTIGA
ncbi:MAG: protein translocase subunit SecF, partial [Eubacteriales bacterium]